MAMPRSKTHVDLYSHKILAAVVDFLLRAGYSSEAIREKVEVLLMSAAKKQMSRHRKRVSGGGLRDDDTVSAAVLHRWHRESSLLDDNASPRPLRLYGAKDSVEALVRSERPSSPPRAIIEEMRSLGLLLRKGSRYLPRARVATIDRLHPVLIEHVAKSLTRLLETVGRNTSERGVVPLIERFTHVPDLPMSCVDDFRVFSQQHGSAFLASVDDWLEARRVRNAKRATKGAAAGVHVYAYIEQSKPSRATPRAKRA